MLRLWLQMVKEKFNTLIWFNVGNVTLMRANSLGTLFYAEGHLSPTWFSALNSVCIYESLRSVEWFVRLAYDVHKWDNIVNVCINPETNNFNNYCNYNYNRVRLLFCRHSISSNLFNYPNNVQITYAQTECFNYKKLISTLLL